MWSFIVFRFIFHLLISSVTIVLGISDSCVTLNQGNGRCISLKDCGLTSDVLLASSEAYNYAKNSKCGSGGSMVCCSSSGYKHNSKMIISTTPFQQEKFRISTFSDSSVCGIHGSSNKIKGGILTEFEEFPWLAGLEYVSNYDHQNKGIRCGGSLISQRFVLSAAHCIRHFELVLVKVWLGATNVSSEGKNCLNVSGDTHCVDSIQKFNVMKTFAHPLYNTFEKMHDIGLIQLENLVNFTSFLRPICLPSSNSFPLPIHSYLTVSGWGATENSTASDIKLKVDVPLQNNSACENLRTWGNIKINSEQLCVGGESGRDSCPGDSGGPLMKSYRNANGNIQWVEVGIVSYGLECGVRGQPSVYVKVASYADWIVEVISDNGDSCKTPNDEQAKCVPISACRVIQQAINSFKNDAIEFAKQSQCGFDVSPLVCCGTVGTFLELNHTTITELPKPLENPADPWYKGGTVWIHNADYIGKLYKEMVKTNQGSFLVSPLSVQIIFGLISRGAKGNTSKQITDSLNIPKGENTNRALFQQLTKLLQINDQNTLSSGNKIYLAEGFTIKKNLGKTAVDIFSAEIDTINFGQPQEAAEMINKWVANKTHDKIHNLINSESLGPDTVAVLINALYFQGTWVKEFEETYKFPFYTTPDKQIDIDMMTISDEFNCYNSKELDAKFLELPYKGEQITMTFVLPNSHSGLSNLEDRLPEVFFTAPKYRVQSVEAIIPKFKIESTIPFVPILKSLGIKDAFNYSKADFSGISKGVVISTVVQKTFIEVDEKGTTAAAATGVGFDRISGGGFIFTANHPFLFYLKHKTLGVFFIGRYSGPSEV